MSLSMFPHQLARRHGLALALALAAGAARAGCWTDPQVVRTAESIVEQSFPGLRARMPRVLVCDAGAFGPNVGGDYTSGMHRIRVPAWQLGSGNLVGVLQHELCHAQVSVDGADDGRAQGHGVAWMACLLKRGWGAEAQRVAGLMPGAEEALALAGGVSRPGWAPPAVAAEPQYVPPVVAPPQYVPPVYVPRCQLVQQRRWVVMPSGHVVGMVAWVQVCQ